MSNNESNKINKKRKKKRNEMLLEDYAKENNLSINLTINYENDIEDTQNNKKKSNYLIYQQNIINIKKNETPKNNKNISNENNLNRKESETDYNSSRSLNIEWHKQISTSTNNSSIDDENKNNNNDKKVNKIIKSEKIIKNENNIKNEKTSLKITNSKINFGNFVYKKNINNIILNNTYNPNNYYINNNFNYHFNNFNNNVNNYYINNNSFNNMNLYNYNYNYNYKSYNYILTYSYYLYSGKLKNVQNSINDIEKEIKKLENKTLKEMFLEYQTLDLVNFLKKKNKILNDDNNNHLNINSEKEKNPEHPYFYTNHNEETQIKNVLYLIEGLFYDENLKKDYNLLSMLNRDGYASLKQLEKHPQLSIIKMTEIHLKTVFSEHRENEITETVETFDDILIRNKNWVKIKKEIDDIENIKKFNINSMKNIKNYQMKKLLDKKQNLLNIKGDIINQYQLNYYNIQQKMNEYQFNYNNNIYI